MGIRTILRCSGTHIGANTVTPSPMLLATPVPIHEAFDSHAPSLSIIVPMWNEIAALPTLIEHLQPYRQRGCEVILVDGGSEDGSAALASGAGFRVIDAPRSRARQMNAGARAAQGETVLFLHADTRLPNAADRLIRNGLASSSRSWGRFDVQIAGRSRLLRLIGAMINFRSRLSGIATGDQALFLRREVFVAIGGFPDQPLMEDIELSRRLKQYSRPVCLRTPVITSGRRWETRGVARTVVLMWRLRFLYWLGTPAERLAQLYR